MKTVIVAAMLLICTPAYAQYTGGEWGPTEAGSGGGGTDYVSSITGGTFQSQVSFDDKIRLGDGTNYVEVEYQASNDAWKFIDSFEVASDKAIQGSTALMIGAVCSSADYVGADDVCCDNDMEIDGILYVNGGGFSGVYSPWLGDPLGALGSTTVTVAAAAGDMSIGVGVGTAENRIGRASDVGATGPGTCLTTSSITCAASTNSLTGGDDLLIEGKLEVDGNMYADSAAAIAGTLTVDDIDTSTGSNLVADVDGGTFTITTDFSDLSYPLGQYDSLNVILKSTGAGMPRITAEPDKYLYVGHHSPDGQGAIYLSMFNATKTPQVQLDGNVIFTGGKTSAHETDFRSAVNFLYTTSFIDNVSMRFGSTVATDSILLNINPTIDTRPSMLVLVPDEATNVMTVQHKGYSFLDRSSTNYDTAPEPAIRWCAELADTNSDLCGDVYHSETALTLDSFNDSIEMKDEVTFPIRRVHAVIEVGALGDGPAAPTKAIRNSVWTVLSHAEGDGTLVDWEVPLDWIGFEGTVPEEDFELAVYWCLQGAISDGNTVIWSASYATADFDAGTDTLNSSTTTVTGTFTGASTVASSCQETSIVIDADAVANPLSSDQVLGIALTYSTAGTHNSAIDLVRYELRYYSNKLPEHL